MGINENCPVGIVEKAYMLVSELEVTGKPDKATDWDDWSYNQILAHVRHEHTNYEELLNELPDCPIECSAYEEYGLDGIACQHRGIAHDILKWAVKSLADSLMR